MTALQRIQAVLAEADQALARLASDCVNTRDFDGATACIEAARKLSTLLTSTPEESMDAQKAAKVAALPHINVTGNYAAALAPAQTASRPSRVRKGDYPKFVRDGDSLIKIGWSKSGKTEYEHKSPQKVLANLVPVIAKFGASGKKFSMDKLLPLKDEDGGEIPGYQAYLCLAWLRTAGLVQQHGRQGYTIPRKTDIASTVEAAWAKLPNR